MAEQQINASGDPNIVTKFKSLSVAFLPHLLLPVSCKTPFSKASVKLPSLSSLLLPCGICNSLHSRAQIGVLNQYVQHVTICLTMCDVPAGLPQVSFVPRQFFVCGWKIIWSNCLFCFYSKHQDLDTPIRLLYWSDIYISFFMLH